ncbi:pro-sigmaK processing inhibitor BofA [Peribacillus saganii]|uniref:Pro-sigmaK processing inhibitor BofA n=1 Tax=Peribacillus saganii TaxID=2303992 RepID=A0A372LTJ1_9BACI|nr:pro-sigmaK processing inhibitor BofA family protein [Peribacillus saganii]RFU71531.1 pro-sigmaK processing inhibitor BofA [Peribacillus saganii]
MEPIVIISVIGGLILLLLVAGAPLKPVRLVGQCFIKLIIGAVFLFFLNALGGNIGLHVPINAITAAVAGILGIPGLFALAAIEYWVV